MSDIFKLEERLNNLELDIKNIEELLKKLDKLVLKRTPEDIVNYRVVLDLKDCFLKVYKQQPFLFKDFIDFETKDTDLIFKKNRTNVAFKKLIYSYKYD